MVQEVTLSDVQEAAKRIRQYIHRTPVATCSSLDEMASSNGTQIKLLMKCENLQKVGAFKIRGATNAITTLLQSLESTDQKSSNLTVITHSSGNHAQALAYAARALGVSCQVVMPSNSASVKKDAVRGYGAIITECIPTLQAREDTTKEIIDSLRSASQAVEFIPPYDDVRIIAGQGTLALELLEQATELERPLDVLITPVGGGGMLSGCAITAKSIDPGIFIIGAEPAAADDAHKSFYSKSFVPAVNPNTVADGLRTSLGQINLHHILKYVNAIYTVSEEQIIRAMRLVYERVKLVIEPSSAVTLAVALYSQEFKAVLKELAKNRGKGDADPLNVGLVFSGGNVDLLKLSALFSSV